MLLLEEPSVQPVPTRHRPQDGCSLGRFLELLGNRLPAGPQVEPASSTDSPPGDELVPEAPPGGELVYESVYKRLPESHRYLPDVEDAVVMIERHELEASAWIATSGAVPVPCGWCGQAHAANLLRSWGGCGPKPWAPESVPADHSDPLPERDRPFLLDWPKSRPIPRNRREEEAGWRELAQWTQRLDHECGGIDEVGGSG